MILRSVDGSVELVGTRMSIGIPASGDARYILDAGAGGRLNVSWMHSPCAVEQSGRVILVVGEDELVITSPRTLEVTEDGNVALTLSEYVQASAALPAIGTKLGEFEARIAALETAVSRVSDEPLQPADLNETGTTCPSGEGE